MKDLTEVLGILGALILPASDPLPTQWQADTIRVRIFPHLGTYSVPQGRETVIDTVTFQSPGPCRLLDSAPGAAPPAGPAPLPAAGLVVRAQELGSPKTLDCGGAPVTVLREPTLKAFRYTGRFHLNPRSDASGTAFLEVVNELPFETYLQGVVPTEVPSSWPEEALKAQAIAARTYAFHEVATKLEALPPGSPAPDFHLDDTVQSQAYLGLTKAVPATDRAVQATAGQIVTYEGRVIRAYFSADSGGHTESAKNAWGSELPYCQARAEVYDSEAFPTRWTKEWTTPELERVARERAWIGPSDTITSVEVRDSERWASGRASLVHFRLKSGKTVSIPAPQVRLALGLRSTLFQVESKGDGSGTVFQGRGWGHGVGMAQYGAWALATTRGWKAEEILKFYYTGTEVTRLPTSP